MGRKKPPGFLAETTQRDGYTGRLLFTIASEAKWMSAGFHLTGNLRNVSGKNYFLSLRPNMFFPVGGT